MIAADAIFRLSGAMPRAADVEAWFDNGDPLRDLARRWFDVLRASGPGLGELLHDGHPTICLGDAAFAYVDAFATHVSLGFFHGMSLPDPAGLLAGNGKRMRHVKLRFDRMPDEAALSALLAAAYADIRKRVRSHQL